MQFGGAGTLNVSDKFILYLTITNNRRTPNHHTSPRNQTQVHPVHHAVRLNFGEGQEATSDATGGQLLEEAQQVRGLRVLVLAKVLLEKGGGKLEATKGKPKRYRTGTQFQKFRQQQC